MVPPHHIKPPIFKPAKPPKDDWSVEDLRDHLQTAIVLELTTIPLYLYAMYTLKDETSDAWKTLLGVVAQEMLHLALAGNALVAVGGQPVLYGRTHTPSYPCDLLYDDVALNLREGTKANWKTFVDLEAPYPTSGPKPNMPGEHILPDYNSIGEFYEAIQAELRGTAHSIQPTQISKQFSDADGLWRPSDPNVLTPIPDLATALGKMQLIIDQGEGSPAHMAGGHYEQFEKLYSGPLQWETYPVVENPHTENYRGLKYYAVSRTVDATFCWLLLTLQTLWTLSDPVTRKNLVKGNFHAAMHYVIPPLSKILVSQPYGTNGLRAAPCFDFFEFKSHNPLTDLKATIQEAIDAYSDDIGNQKILIAVQDQINTFVALPE